jgi:DNA-binding transcriptional regulator GbsR (MarR family)
MEGKMLQIMEDLAIRQVQELIQMLKTYLKWWETVISWLWYVEEMNMNKEIVRLILTEEWWK